MPWVETPTHYVFLGMHDSLDECVRQATLQSVEFLQEKEKLDFYDAYALTSIAVDFAVSRALLPADGLRLRAQAHLQRKPDLLVPAARCRRNTNQPIYSLLNHYQ